MPMNTNVENKIQYVGKTQYVGHCTYNIQLIVYITLPYASQMGFID